MSAVVSLVWWCLGFAFGAVSNDVVARQVGFEFCCYGRRSLDVLPTASSFGPRAITIAPFWFWKRPPAAHVATAGGRAGQAHEQKLEVKGFGFPVCRSPNSAGPGPCRNPHMTSKGFDTASQALCTYGKGFGTASRAWGALIQVPGFVFTR